MSHTHVVIPSPVVTPDNAGQARASHAYQRCQIQVDDPLGLVLRLYDGLLASLQAGAERIETGEFEIVASELGRALDIVGYLQGRLDLEQGGEVAVNLDRLYSIARERIVSAHLRRNSEEIRGVAQLLEPLRDAWQEARASSASPSEGEEETP